MSRVYLIGTGPDGRSHLGGQAWAALGECRMLIGAQRLLDAHGDSPCAKAAAVAPEAIAALIRKHADLEPFAILLSGDTGFYSGAKRLREALAEHAVTALPGICAHQLLCARLGVSWEDAALMSVHGRSQDVCAEALNRAKVLVLTGSNCPPQAVCADLCEAGLPFVRVTVGSQLGYPEERIHTGTADELRHMAFDPLSVLLLENGRPFVPPQAVAGLPDDAFLRAGAPMTKREVRAVSLAHLALRERDTVWDVGAGTGSVAVECAMLARRGRVFAVERDADACEGIRQNREKFGAWHLRVVEGEAPEALAGLPAPDRVFVGGSGGRLREILRLAREKNPAVRAVVNAVTLETLTEALAALESEGYAGLETAQVLAARARPVGAYHMMTAQNPVFILSGGGV